ncbi:MAG: hypothetical protein NVS4B6_25180 [Mycobacterium sp.]
MTSTLETPAPPAGTGSTSWIRGTAVTWNRVCLAMLLVATAVMYLWKITVNGMGN